MQVCQNPNCPSPFNILGSDFCLSCNSTNFGPLFRNRYRVIRRLGEGGFGRTYEAEDAERLDDPCVIKQFVPEAQGTTALLKSTELFKREAKQLYELGEHHPQIPRLIAYFEQGKCLYLVQEFIKGQTLLQEAQQGAFSEQQIWEVLADLLPVLKFIHERNVIHRDIKPENIIRRQTDNRLVLIDFGGAKQLSTTTLGRVGTGIYSLGYAPIEQMAGQASQVSDLYSLGSTCVRLLTQCLPSPDEYGNIQNDIYDAIEGRWLWREHLEQREVTVSDELAQILEKLLKLLPKQRYQSAEEVLKDLNSRPQVTRLPAIVWTPQPAEPIREQGTPILQPFTFDVVTVDVKGMKINQKSHQAQLVREDLADGVILEMVFILGGTYLMGSLDKEKQRSRSEGPQHPVTVSPFFMGKNPVTQLQWQTVAEKLPQVNSPLNPDPSRFKGANRPVENVSWYDATEFCARLTKKTGRDYRLPSEAQWEYACRGGTTTPFHFGETITPELANYDGNYTYGSGPKGKYRQETTPVESFRVANAFGLYDMHGNVWEWCADPWHDNYRGAPSDGNVWEFGGNPSYRVLRGGSWYGIAKLCRAAYRDKVRPFDKDAICGFRVALSSTRLLSG